MENLAHRLGVLASAARYDVACASSGSAPRSRSGFGETSRGGICHSWTADGRCVSLLKILLSNECVYDCAYCVHRCSNSRRRVSFTPNEIAGLTIEFYRRNYIEGLFLSSAVHRCPDNTMEEMVAAAALLRKQHGFRGYIHLKVIPGCSLDLVERAGRLADRISVNIELPSEGSLRRLAPQKNRRAILTPMARIGNCWRHGRRERRKNPRAPRFAPAGHSTQLIIGATPESDQQILLLSESLYNAYALRRVYYSAYVPVNSDGRLPVAGARPPLLREHRLYQADWLVRRYGFQAGELLPPGDTQLDSALDPKASWALRHPEYFPVEINRADYHALLRVPGIGVTSAGRIVSARRDGRLSLSDLQRMGAVVKRAQFFVTVNGRLAAGRCPPVTQLRRHLADRAGRVQTEMKQLPLFPPEELDACHAQHG